MKTLFLALAFVMLSIGMEAASIPGVVVTKENDLNLPLEYSILNNTGKDILAIAVVYTGRTDNPEVSQMKFVYVANGLLSGGTVQVKDGEKVYASASGLHKAGQRPINNQDERDATKELVGPIEFTLDAVIFADGTTAGLAKHSDLFRSMEGYKAAVQNVRASKNIEEIQHVQITGKDFPWEQWWTERIAEHVKVLGLEQASNYLDRLDSLTKHKAFQIQGGAK